MPVYENHLIMLARIALFTLQFFYIVSTIVEGAKDERSRAIATHFSLNNLLHVLFLVLFVRSVFGWAEFILLLNFVNLTWLYFFQQSSPRFVHASIISGPLAWTFIAVYWNGSIAIPVEGHARDILVILSMWGIMGYGMFFLVAYKVSPVSVIIVIYKD